MSITLNEREWAESALKEKDLGAKPTETLSRVAKYYFDAGRSRPEVRGLVESFLKTCDPYVSVVKWSDTLDNVVKYASKRHLIVIDSIKITKPEIETIRLIKGVQAQRLAFTLLCIAKFNYLAGNNQEYWVTTPDSDIMRMANIKSSIKRQSQMFASLRDAGLIEFSKRVDNTSVRVLFVSGGDVALEVKDFRNLGYQYLNYIDQTGTYFVCKNCGIMCKSDARSPGRKREYCNSCAVKIRMKQNVDSVMRLRNK